MAALGTIPAIGAPPAPLNPATLIVTNYQIHRGLVLGAITVAPDRHVGNPPLISPVTDYIVRQTRILYKQIWPGRGQRFPQ